MTIEAYIDANHSIQIGTAKDWDDFTRWALALRPQKDYAELRHLCNFGWNEPVSCIIDDLERALEKGTPESKSARAVADGLLDYMRTSRDFHVVTITGIIGVGGSNRPRCKARRNAADRSVKIIPDGHKEGLPAVPVRVELSDADKLRSNWDEDMPEEYKGIQNAEVIKQSDFSE